MSELLGNTTATVGLTVGFLVTVCLAGISTSGSVVSSEVVGTREGVEVITVGFEGLLIEVGRMVGGVNSSIGSVSTTTTTLGDNEGDDDDDDNGKIVAFDGGFADNDGL